MFKKLSNDSVNKVEKSISKYWNSLDLLDKSIESRKDDNLFVFYDGPATANGNPGIHHIVAKYLKDSFCKYKTMQGYIVK